MADEVRDDLYRTRPEDFTALRTRLAAAAKQRGDTAGAQEIGASRKPTTAAWVVNRLALDHRDAKQRLTDLGERLRAAHAVMDGDRIRELSTEQRELIHELARAAFQAADVQNPPAALRDDVTDTLQAAIADPRVADQLGRLAKAQRYSGFGEFDAAAPGFAAPTGAGHQRSKPPVERRRNDLEARRQQTQANAVVAAAERAKALAGDELSEQRAELDIARRRHDEARRALREAERTLSAAEAAYAKAQKADRDAVELVKQAKARLPDSPR
ncbi:MAG: hypothetical protein JO044_14670 [Mycobacteriaceae bacterium]|nr:hypothetical protein [Mycobacteriaceae bacterium]